MAKAFGQVSSGLESRFINKNSWGNHKAPCGHRFHPVIFF